MTRLPLVVVYRLLLNSMHVYRVITAIFLRRRLKVELSSCLILSGGKKLEKLRLAKSIFSSSSYLVNNNQNWEWTSLRNRLLKATIRKQADEITLLSIISFVSLIGALTFGNDREINCEVTAIKFVFRGACVTYKKDIWS